MNAISATEARAKLYRLIDEAAAHKPILITGQRNNAVLVSEKDWNALQETLFLVSIPGVRDSIIKGGEELVSECKPLEDSEQALPLAPAVYIVGAGPGDPDLLTVKAQKLLRQADVILFADSLVPEEILHLCRPDAEIIRTANKTLEEILPVMIERVRSHQSVIRLQSGDPSLYSAIHEQMQALAEADVPFEVIPGISAFQAAAAKLKVELTVPGLVQTIILSRISGRTEVPVREELASLAAHQASLCLYLSARHVEDAQSQLLEHYPAQTPVAICFRLGWSDEKIWLVSLEQMAAVTQQEKLIRTTLYVVSPALGEATARSRLYHPEHAHLFRPKPQTQHPAC